MGKFIWKNGTQIEPAKVEIDGTSYNVTPAQYEGETPLNASNLNAMEDGIYDDIGDLSDLPTTDKSSLVGAISELNPSINGEVIYDKSNGAYDSIKLSKSVATAKKIDIIYGNTSSNQVGLKTETIYNPNNKYVNLSVNSIESSGTEIQQYNSIFYLNDDEITRTQNKALTFKPNSVAVWTSNSLLIYKVIAYY